MLKVDHLKIYEHYKLLRVVDTSNILIKSKLNDKEKIQLAKSVRVWSYINSLILNIAKDLSMDISDKENLSKASILIHMSIFEYDQDKSIELYYDMKKQLKVGVWKEIFVEMAEEASIDYNNIKNKKRVHSFSLLPRFDHYVRNFIETCNKNKKT